MHADACNKAKADFFSIEYNFIFKKYMIEQIHESLTDFSDYKEEQKDLEPNTNFVFKNVELHCFNSCFIQSLHFNPYS